MRDLKILDKYRDTQFELRHYGMNGGSTEGVFRLQINPRRGTMVTAIASCGEGWEHVSVSTPVRCPTWDEMEFVKRLFFNDDETVMQLHVPTSEHISVHHYCLHLWRPIGIEIPRPPASMVA